jgi:signal peptidase
MRKSNKKSLEVLSSSIFYFTVAVLSFYIFVELIMPNNTLRIFGFKPYSVITDSMEPVINDGDFIIVIKPELDELNPDDIITFYADYDEDGQKEVITHYIDSITDDGVDRTYKTRGYDKPNDSWVLTDDDILGVYYFKIPNFGNFLKSPFSLILLTIMLALIILIRTNIKSVKKESKVKRSVEKPME